MPAPMQRPVSRALLALGLLVLPATGCGTASAAGEREALTAVLELAPGAAVADVGAGEGEWTVALAEAVGPTGHVWATEVDDEALQEIRDRVEAAGLTNVSVVAGSQTSTGLPDGCCDAVLLRMVYHHFTEPAAMRRDLLRALRPGALLAVIDIQPQRHWSELEGVPDRGGHGIGRSELLEEMTSSGFEVVSSHADWNGDEDRYCIVFRAPPS